MFTTKSKPEPRPIQTIDIEDSPASSSAHVLINRARWKIDYHACLDREVRILRKTTEGLSYVFAKVLGIAFTAGKAVVTNYRV